MVVGSAVSHCEPADCRCHHPVNSVARSDGNRIADWSFLFLPQNRHMIVLNSSVLQVSVLEKELMKLKTM